MPLTTSRPCPSKLCLLHHFVRYDIRQFGMRLGRRLTGMKVEYLAAKHYAMPDSELCQRALRLTSACSPAFMLNHCLRSHAFAVAIGKEMKRRYDRELLFIGSILHDLGLTDSYADNDTFELTGARAARAFCLAQGLPEIQSDLVHEMVALHNAVGIADSREPEVALLHFGAGADVIGMHLRDIHPKTVDEILEQYPRQGFSEAMGALIREQLERKPASYMRTMVEMGFLEKMQAIPLDDQAQHNRL